MDESSFSVVVEGGRPWGFTLQGGLEFRAPLRVGKVTPGGKAERSGLIPGDYITSINNTEVQGLKHLDAKQLIINSSSTLQLLCTKTPPVGLFSPPGNKPSPHFSFTSPRSPSPSSHPSRPRASSFTSPSAQPRPRTSSFTSPRSSTHIAPSPSSTSAKTLSLRRPPPPAAVATTPTRGKSDTLPSGRPRPPVNYRGDIGNSSSGVSSSISSAASSPPPHPEGGPLLVSPTRHPPPPAKTEPTRDQLANHVTAIPADTADATVISVNTADMIPNTAETALIPDDTTDTAMIPADTANTTVIPANTRVELDDIIPIISPTGSTAIADLKF
ncbi:PDZ and LIM domain protein 7 [Geodia barretti]|uniref:PDZ and LIM domain protein 7 n=1 Tax=Geodia barretti TaxID=519541 RepID=A0AA35X7H1_GEOBA|nr:PDZ and LIM domain protein 7 [Geodia barretti]